MLQAERIHLAEGLTYLLLFYRHPACSSIFKKIFRFVDLTGTSNILVFALFWNQSDLIVANVNESLYRYFSFFENEYSIQLSG